MRAQILVRVAFDEHFEQVGAFPIVHWNSDLRFQLLQNLPRGVGWHRKCTADRNHRDIHPAKGFDLLFGELVAQITQMSNTDCAEVKDKRRAFERVAELLLVNGNRVNQNISHRRADLVPFRAVIGKSSQDDGVAVRQLHVIVIGMFSADGDGVWCDFRSGVKARRDGVGDYFRALLRGNLEKVVAKELNRHVGLGGVGRLDPSGRNIELPAGRIRSFRQDD